MLSAHLLRIQTWVYLGAFGCGVALASMTTVLRPLAEVALWPTVAIMLLSVFLSTPLGSIRTAARDRHFVAGALTGNFVVIPALEWLLTQWVGLEGPALMGVVVVWVTLAHGSGAVKVMRRMVRD